MDASAFHMLGEQAWAVWAKSADNGSDFMPLPLHMADAAQVAGLLWEEWVPEAARQVVYSSAGAGNPKALRQRVRGLACFLAATHDTGKASPAFASQVPALVPRMESAGLTFPLAGFTTDERRKCPHSWVSAAALREWAMQRGIRGPAVVTLGAVLAGHHGIFPQLGDLRSAQVGARGAGGREWAALRSQLLSAAASMVGFSEEVLAALPPTGLSQPAQLVLSGFVIVCDWIASNADLFPLRRLGSEDGGRAAAALDALGLTRPWKASLPDVDELFRTRFGFPEGSDPRPVQLEAARVALEVTGPELMIIEAPTGEGKTEAAQAAAEILTHRFGFGGVFFGLPTQATSDAMFDRVLAWMRPILGPGQETSVSLSHGKAQFNRTFGELRRASSVRDVWDDPGDQSAIRALAWLTRKKAILANFVVGTIDQVLLMALQTRHVALRHLGLAGKIVILDEIHAADEFMFVYLDRALEWLAAFNVPVIALSATLPPARRRALIEAYARGRSRSTSALNGADVEALGTRAGEATGYPLITNSGTAFGNIAVQPSSRSVSAAVDFLAPEVSLPDLLGELLTDGGCAAVVCSTVRRAQAAYTELVTRFGDDTVLLHSRFITADRLEIEARLRSELGPPDESEPRPARRIVVATQVIEQSLDLDFDVMIADLAPIDLVFQRMGRLHRHRRPATARPMRLREPRLIIRGVSQHPGQPPEFEPGAERIYGAAGLLRSMAVLQHHLATAATLSGVTDVARLVARAYDPDCPVPAGWEDRWQEADRLATAESARREQRARTFCVSAPKPGPLFGWMQAMTSEDGHAGQPAVRDIEDGIEVVCVLRDADGRLRTLPWLQGRGDLPLDLGTQIEPGLARAVATCTLRLPAYLARGSLGDRIVRELEVDGLDTWQDSPWLRGQLPLALDSNLTRMIAGWLLRYDVTLGLVVEKERHDA